MKISLRKVMSMVLIVAMLSSLFIPTAFADETYPSLTMTLVDDNGNPVAAVSPDAELWLRVSATVANSVYAVSVKINDLRGMKFNTSKSIKKIYELNSAFSTFEINRDTGLSLTETSTALLFACKMGAEPTVPYSGEFAFVDIPVKVTGEVGDAVEASFTADGSFGVYVFEESDADPYYIDADMLNVNSINDTIKQIPYAIESVTLDPEFAAIEKQEPGSGYVFPGFGDSKLKATYDLDRDGNGAKDTFSYDIITNLADAPNGAYAYIDTSALEVTAAGIYPLNVTVYDDSIKDTNGSASGQYSGNVNVCVAGSIDSEIGDYPSLTMKFVDDNGVDVDVVSPRSKLWLRVSATVTESLYEAHAKIGNLRGIEFDTSKNIKKIYESNPAFSTFEINSSSGIILSSGEADILFSSKSGENPTVAYSGEIAFVDIPVKVTGVVGDAVKASFIKDGSLDVYVFEKGLEETYYLDAGMLNVNYIDDIIKSMIPYEIVSIALNPEFAPIVKQKDGSNYVFPGFGDRKVKATYDLDRDENGIEDTFAYNIVTDMSKAPEDVYAYIDVSALNVTEKGEYELDVTVYDSSIKDTNGAAPGEYSGYVVVVVEGTSGIVGKVTTANTTGQVLNFSSSVPAGALITAIPVSTSNMSYVGNMFGITGYANDAAYYAVADANGDFELKLDPGDYHVIISHTMYAMRKMGPVNNLTIMRTILDGQSKQIISVGDDEIDMGTISLRYAYYGDMNLDGIINPTDYGLFKANFGNTAPVIQ